MMQTRSTRSSIGIFLLVSIIVFFVSLGLAAYVFLEKKLLIQDITTEQNTIASNQTGIVSDTDTVQNIIDLNSRIIVGNQLLANHVAISPVFAFLQEVTLQDVRFNNFVFSSAGKDANGNATVQVQLAGVARDWESVASQEDEFDLPDWKNIISQPKLSGFSLNADGSISFSFSAIINPKYLSYASANANSQQNSVTATTTQSGQ